MKHLCVFLLLITAVGCASPSSKPSSKPPRPPNVLLIIADDLCNDLGCYGAPVVTPNIDRLAARGLRFDSTYCQYPLCGPSRCSFLSGLRPQTTGVLTNGLPVRHKLKDVVTLPQLFRQHGYFVARVGKLYHLDIPQGVGTPGPDDPLSWDYTFNPPGAEFTTDGDEIDPTPKMGQGFHRVMGRDPDGKVQHDYQAATEAIRLLNDHKDSPFFLAVGFIRPHVPEIAPRKFFDLYDVDKIELPTDGRQGVPPMAFHTAAPNFGMNERDCRESKRAYYATTSFMDAQAGRVLDELHRLRLDDDTLVVFMSDHGYLLGQHQAWQKLMLFEDACRVPMIIATPGMTAARGRSTQAITESIDLFPTVADLCGLPAPEALEGRSMAPLLRKPHQRFKDAAYTIVELPQQKGRSVRTDRWRYTEWDAGRAGVELYDHQRDPRELTNLVHDPAQAETIRRLSAMLHRVVPTSAPAGSTAPATQTAALPFVKLALDGGGFVRDDGTPFVPWGVNYDRDFRSRLIEDYWSDEWSTVEQDFREIKALGANIVRVHLQFGKFMDAPDRPNAHALDRLERLTHLAKSLGLYLDITGLGCYRKSDVPPWYEALEEPARWAAQAQFWAAIAERLKDRPGVFAYDLMNEPVVPAGKQTTWLVPFPLGGFYYAQHVTLDPAGRDRADVAQAWTRTLASAIRQHDRRHLITIGLLPNSVDGTTNTSGFTPRAIAPEVDYLSVHVYPRHGRVDESIDLLKQFAAAGKPVIVEEMFPLACSADELSEFIDASRDQHVAAGWLGFYWGKPLEELKRSPDAGDALTAAWLELFERKAPRR